MKTKIYNRFNMAHGGICGLVASLISTAVSEGGFNPVLTLFIMSYFLMGGIKYGSKKENLNDFAGLKSALIASAIWPYLAWKKYDQKLQAPSSVITYDAYVNDVLVGMLTDADYSAIRRQVLRDPRVYIAQFFNIGGVVIKLLNSFAINIPLLAFWGILGIAYFDPTLYVNITYVLQQGPGAIREVAGKYFAMLVQLFVVTLMAMSVVAGGVPGFQNKFDRAVSKLIRQRLKVVAEGDVTILARATGTVVSAE